MLVCCDDDSLTEDDNISPKKESKRFIWNHGSMYYSYVLVFVFQCIVLDSDCVMFSQDSPLNSFCSSIFLT